MVLAAPSVRVTRAIATPSALTTSVITQFSHAPLLQPFDARILAFTTDLSRALSADPNLRTSGAAQALAYWLRPTETQRLQRYVQRLEGADAVLVPRGTVFHIPPSNVDTLFVYSWALALLVGNRNVVRLSANLSGLGAHIAALTSSVLARPVHRDVAAGTAFVQYGHEEEPTRALSALCDVRVLWGGDAAVLRLRTVPLAPHAIELVFPDRYSGAALDVRAVDALGADARDALADRFAADAFMFGQNACASPRLVAWIGDSDAATRVAADFWQRVARALAHRGITVDASDVLRKFTASASSAINEPVKDVVRVCPEITVVRLHTLDDLQRVTPGSGFFHEISLASLNDLAPHVRRRDQTLTVFGFSREELLAMVRTINGRGIDRLVPVGQALAFDHVWDGYDLLQQFTRRISLPSCEHVR